jgi:uncharacterized protein (TIGR00288 family)
MNVTSDTRSTRIAVFIDFDNVEIGVKNTIGGQFDIGLVLDAIKERGEIVTEIAYSDWKRAGDYSRLLTQHAIRMVQRNMTPGGDKNGADITMALDALEMCFTHSHINAFVIVGGDSDFISLVEKLKQYGRKVIVVGGRQFTSTTMQQNCHEFVAYENLVGTRGAVRQVGRSGGRPSVVAGASSITKALPLIMRALKVLSDREVTPQLGLLKSTLLQLDSTFSEREYGAGSFRDFMEKVAAAGAVTLRESGRSMLVEANPGAEAMFPAAPAAPVESGAVGDTATQAPLAAAAPIQAEGDEEALPPSPMTPQDGMRTLQAAFGSAATPPRWPMYVRQAKQFLRNVVEGFDERNYGFSSVVDMLRAAGKEGILRVERDRQGAVRVFAGPKLTVAPAPVPEAEPIETPAQDEVPAVEEIVVTEVEVVTEVVADAVPPLAFDPIIEDIEDGELTQSAAAIAAAGIPGSAVVVGQKKPRRREPAKATGVAAAAGRATSPRARKTTRAKPAARRS